MNTTHNIIIVALAVLSLLLVLKLAGIASDPSMENSRNLACINVYNWCQESDDTSSLHLSPLVEIYET
jgi:hypothetical protein